MKKSLLYVPMVFLAVGLTMLMAQQKAEQRLKKSKITQTKNQTRPEPSTTPESNEGFDEAGKRDAVIKLVEDGIAFLKNNELEQACNKFTHTKEFVRGDLYLFVMDINGTALAHGNDEQLLWQNLYDLRDAFGTYFVQEMIQKAKAGGGWLTYEWRGASKVTYVQKVTKRQKTFVIGSGYYPHSKANAVVNLVNGAVSLFEQVIQSGRPKEEAFSAMSYPLGKFVRGDLYLYALDFNGNIMAQGDRPGLIGTNALEYKDPTGKQVNKVIIEKLKETSNGVWVDYISKRAQKRAYARKVQDEKGNNYFIACGYYPGAGRDEVVDLVQRGFTFMKGHGLSEAATNFSDKRIKDFRYGDLYLFVYDMKGTCVAHGGNEELIGKNFWNAQDQDGRYYIREIISKAKAGGGWVDAKLKNSFKSMYVEEIDMGVNKFVIGSGLYPISKKETMQLLVKTGAGFLRTGNLFEVFANFVDRKGQFLRGDLYLTVFDQRGICYAYGTEHNLIWRNLMSVKDDDGRPIVKLMINLAKRGPGTIKFKLNGVTRYTYIEQVQRDGKTFVIGSGYYM